MNHFRLLRADEIDARISTVNQKGVSILLYKDARCDMNILDETVGVGDWQRKHEVIDGQLFCSVGIYIKERDEWIWKQDVGTESYTEKEKGRASDSFKRACFNLGIGRELYTAPFIWIPSGKCEVKENGKGGFTCYDRFEVKSISYDLNSRINSLTIINTSKHNMIAYQMGKEQPETEDEPATEKERKRTFALAMNKFEQDKERVKQFYKDHNVDYMKMTASQYVEIIKALE